jgi:hypothetical protein
MCEMQHTAQCYQLGMATCDGPPQRKDPQVSSLSRWPSRITGQLSGLSTEAAAASDG